MDNALSLENVFHSAMLEKCKDEESIQWENARHDIMVESIKESIRYYSFRYKLVDKELERE